MFASKAFELSRRLGWPHSEREWEIMEGLGRLYFLGNDQRLWATSLITNVSEDWFNIGMVLVDPDFRKRGSGSLITKLSMAERLTGGSIVSLTSSLIAERVYRNLDFIEIASMLDLQRDPLVTDQSVVHPNCREMLKQDVPGVAALEKLYLKINRQAVLKAWIDFAQLKVLVEDSGNVRGYGCLIERANRDDRYGVIGPLVATNVDAAQSILRHITSTYPHTIEIFIINDKSNHSIAVSRTEMINFLGDLGFKEKQVLPIMTWQGHPLPAYQSSENWCPVSLALG